MSEAPKKSWRPFATMRALAGAMLIAMVALYLVSVLNAGNGAVWGYTRAFAEAAMVGGLADWFAVTAIFRRPLGLPIPHTAVIPRSKDRIADALGEFVAVNFLAPDVVRDRLGDQDLAGGVARQLADPASARRIADGVIDALPAIVELFDDETVNAFMRRQIEEFGKDARLANLAGQALRVLTEHGRHQPVLDAALSEGWRALEENEAAIRAQVRSKTSWAWRLISLDARASDALISAIETTLREAAHDQNHPLRRRVTDMLNKFSDDLENAPEMRAQIEKLIGDLLSHPSVGAYMQNLWSSLKEGMRRGAASHQTQTRAALADAVASFGQSLRDDKAAQEALNTRLRVFLAELADRHGGDAASLISDTIKSWDSKTMVEKLEQNVGPDLQYIRINGTIIGGLIGLAIHQVTLLIAH